MILFRRIAAHRRYVLFLFIVTLTACATAPTEPTDPLQSTISTPAPTKAAPVPAGSVVAVTFTPGPVQVQPTTAQPNPLPTTAAVGTPTVVRKPIAPNNNPTVTTVPTATETSTPAPTPTLGTPGTPDTRLTSTSVVATITALAAVPTYPPTDQPRPTRRAPIVIGAAGDKVPPTSIPSATGITVQSLSERVFAGGTAALSIKTKPQAICELSAIRKGNNGEGEVLQPIPAGATRTAGKDGVIAWIWTVDADASPGPLRLSIDCHEAGVNQVQMLVGS